MCLFQIRMHTIGIVVQPGGRRADRLHGGARRQLAGERVQRVQHAATSAGPRDAQLERHRNDCDRAHTLLTHHTIHTPLCG